MEKTITIKLNGMSDLFWVEEYGRKDGKKYNVGAHSGLYTSKDKALAAAMDSATRNMDSMNKWIFEGEKWHFIPCDEAEVAIGRTLANGTREYIGYYVNSDFIAE